MEVEFPMMDSSLFHKRHYECAIPHFDLGSPYGLYQSSPNCESLYGKTSNCTPSLTTHCDDFLSSALDTSSSDNACSVASSQGYIDIPTQHIEAQLSCDRSPENSLTEELECLAYHSQPVTPIETLGISLDKTTLPPVSVPEIKQPYLDKTYDTSSVMYDNDDLTVFSDLVNCDEVLQSSKKGNSFHEPINTKSYVMQLAHSPKLTETTPFTESNTCKDIQGTQSINSDQSTDLNMEQENSSHATSFLKSLSESSSISDNKKGKISNLQRTALDSIFCVTDRPSRGLVLHIGAELGLHHITVKNFFSNGRRRLRRAAARINDPERTRRENQRRKEKRRLAALAAASAASKEKGNITAIKSGMSESNGHQVPREPAVLSPQRRALMEKLMVKVQRSAAQKGFVPSSCDRKECSPMQSPQFIFKPDCQKVQDETQISAHSRAVCMYPSFTLQSDNFYLDKTPQTENPNKPEGNPISCFPNVEQPSFQEINVAHATNQTPYFDETEQCPFSPMSWQTLLQV